MKEILGKLTQSAKDISRGVVGQTKTTACQGKVELELIQAKSELNKLYRQLGEKIYENRLSPEANPQIEILYEMISKKEKEVKELEKESKEAKARQRDNFESMKRDIKNTWQDNPEERREPPVDNDGYLQMVFCENCNIGNHPEAEYCIACGHKQ